MKWLVNLTFRRRESPEEARKRRLCRKMLELPPEIQYSHVWPGLTTLSGLSALLVALVARRLDGLPTILDQADALGSLDRSALNDSNSSR
jgi:hypothetical protein